MMAGLEKRSPVLLHVAFVVPRRRPCREHRCQVGGEKSQSGRASGWLASIARGLDIHPG